MADVIINPKVPDELKVLAESATEALKAHTAEGKAILLTELRKYYDEVIEDFRRAGADKAVPDDHVQKQMVAAYAVVDGKENPKKKEKALKLFAAIYNKAVWEGLMYAIGVFKNFKNDVLIANEKS